MIDLIDRQALLRDIEKYHLSDGKFQHWVEVQPSVEAEPVVRCKDCKHFPVGTNRDDLVFPDEVCPCYCEDFWYSWKPKDDFYCGNGEWKDGSID